MLMRPLDILLATPALKPTVKRSQVYDEAQRVFSAMLDRQQKAERIKSVVAMLKRYETVFRLPTRIRQATERGEFEQVIAEHRKAKALMETLAASSSEVWRNLFAEVEKVPPPPSISFGRLLRAAEHAAQRVVLKSVQPRQGAEQGLQKACVYLLTLRSPEGPCRKSVVCFTCKQATASWMKDVTM